MQEKSRTGRDCDLLFEMQITDAKKPEMRKMKECRRFNSVSVITMKVTILIIAFTLLIGLQRYSYSSTDEVETYTQQCKNFLNRHSGELNDESFEKLLGYIGSAQICKIEKIYNKLTEEEKNKLKDEHWLDLRGFNSALQM